MKIWYGYGSEHSANLVMLGRFKAESDAATAYKLIEQLEEGLADNVEIGEMPDRYTGEVFDLLSRLNCHSFGPAELEQFLYNVNVRREGDTIVLTTDELDISAYLKLMVDKGARVEIYSAHSYPDTDYGRGK